MLDRLEAAADGSLTTLGPLEKQLEAELRKIRPAALPATLLQALEAHTQGLPRPGSPAVVPFPARHPATAHNRKWWSAAAAVAILGALSALLIPNGAPSDKPIAGQAQNPGLSEHPSVNTEITPTGFSRQVSETSDEGIIWPSAKPHRVVKVVYKERVTMKRADGSTYEVEQPRVEYYVVPTDSD